jgi:hypothetical protein
MRHGNMAVKIETFNDRAEKVHPEPRKLLSPQPSKSLLVGVRKGLSWVKICATLRLQLARYGKARMLTFSPSTAFFFGRDRELWWHQGPDYPLTIHGYGLRHDGPRPKY